MPEAEPAAWRPPMVKSTHLPSKLAIKHIYCVLSDSNKITLNLFYSKTLEIFISGIIEWGASRRVFGKSFRSYSAITFRNTIHHSLTSPSEKDAICVEHVFLCLNIIFRNPSRFTIELPETPLIVVTTHICIPEHTCKICLQTLYLNLGGCFFKIIRWSEIGFIFEEPVHCTSLCGKTWTAKGLKRAETFEISMPICSEPLACCLSHVRALCEYYWIAVTNNIFIQVSRIVVKW